MFHFVTSNFYFTSNVAWNSDCVRIQSSNKREETILVSK